MSFVSTPTPQLITALTIGEVRVTPNIEVANAERLLLECLVTRGAALSNVTADVEVSEDGGTTWSYLTRVDPATGVVTRLVFNRQVTADENFMLDVDVGHAQLARVTFEGIAADGSESLTVNGRVGRNG